MSTSTLLSNKLLELRKKAKLTQTQLGERVGVSGGAISQFEKALNRPTSETLKKLSDVLEFDLLPLFANKDSVPSHSVDNLPESSASLLGRKIEHARKRKRISQGHLADLVGVSRASIALYEAGKGNPSLKVLEKLADELGLSFSNLAVLGDERGYEGYSDAAIMLQKLEEDNIIRSYLINMHFQKEEEYIEIDLFPPPGLLISPELFPQLTSRPDSDVDQGIRWPTLSVLRVPGVDYTDARIITVSGNRMAPRYPDKSKHVIHPIHDAALLKKATGVHAFLIEDRTIMVRYISSNIDGRAILKDAQGYENGIDLTSDISVWKVGQAVHMPAEE
jgi:transcriptional regulator with XRE-family HTH domain